MIPQDILEMGRRDPLKMAKVMWPSINFWSRQREIIRSCEEDDITIVPSSHEMGKDFVTGFVALREFLIHPEVRIITTSVKDDHLRVLWGEIGRFVSTSRIPLKRRRGGNLLVLHREIKKYKADGNLCDISYLKGMVSEKGEGMTGHHAPFTRLIVDEASGVEDMVYENAATWADKILVIGNPYGGDSWFKRMVMQGDLLKKAG